MTPQEAIDIVNDITWFDNGRHYGKIEPARNMVVNALEKQIPKKPEHDNGAWSICPACFGSVPNDTEEAVNHETSYCDHCGQALDWSDTE